MYFGEGTTLKFSNFYIEDINKTVIINPHTFPMLCKPLPWSDSNFGGYLNNELIKTPLINTNSDSKHKTINIDILYKSINYMSQIKFEINNLLLDFILSKKGEFLFSSKEDKKKPYDIILGQACLLRDREFYIPLRADFRGRIYTDSYYLNFQGDDFSKAIIQFREGEPLTPIGRRYLDIFTANSYNYEGINKNNYEERVKWTQENMEKILSLDPLFIKGAEKKFTFTALCLLYKQLEENPSYEVRLPILFDATCSGIQHLAGLLRDEELSREVNLQEQSESDSVADIYSKLALPINEEINRVGIEDYKYINLRYVKLPRSVLKKPIMTKTYSVTKYGILEQLREHFTKTKITLNGINIYNYNVPSIIQGEITKITEVDLQKIAEILDNILFKKYPLIEAFYNYIKNISKIMNKADIPINWITPNGIEITQFYKKLKGKYKFKLQNKVAILKEYSEDLDKNKQSNSIIPNFIHSLDASHLMNVIIKMNYKYNKPIITIHDCFGAHPNQIPNLQETVKVEFAELYSKEDFINKFHVEIIKTLEKNGFIITCNKKTKTCYVKIGKRDLIIPNPPLLGGFDLKQVKNSIYMIN